MTLLTHDRLVSAAHINRWRGRTVRPYSVLEHTIIGAKLMLSGTVEDYSPVTIKCWMLHDLHETEIVGDVPTPDKRKYMNDLYFKDVLEFDMRIGRDCDMPKAWWDHPAIHTIDRLMIEAENYAVANSLDPSLTFNKDDAAHQFIYKRIVLDARMETHEIALDFWRIWNGL